MLSVLWPQIYALSVAYEKLIANCLFSFRVKMISLINNNSRMKKMILLAFMCMLAAGLEAANSNIKFAQQHIFQTNVFIENKGQFATPFAAAGDIKYGIWNAGQRIYLTNQGILICTDSLAAENSETDSEEEAEPDRLIWHHFRSHFWLRWLGANTHVSYEGNEKTSHTYSFGDKAFQSFGYRSLSIANIYDGIDLQLTIPDAGGIEYSFVVKPGADINQIRMQYNGDLQQLSIGDSVINIQSNTAWTERFLQAKQSDAANIKCTYKILGSNTFGYSFTEHYDPTKALIIDPWVAPLTSLTSSTASANIGYDVDYDHKGNYYVYGGGTTSGFAPEDQMVAMYDTLGTLRWTFMGSIPSIPWDSRGDVGEPGNFVVQKATGSVYVGQGLSQFVGTKVVRLDTNGVYDGFVTVPIADMKECWDIGYRCTNDEVVYFGGSTSRGCSIASAVGGSTFTTIHSFTGSTSVSQDVACAIFDQEGNLFLILSGYSGASFNNHIYKINSSYGGFVWDAYCGYPNLREVNNKPYLLGAGYSSNGINVLAANEKYVFFYDGVNLAAFDKNTGAHVGTDTSLSTYSLKMQSGIDADHQGHVYIGGNSGNIKVFKFTGAAFNYLYDLPITGMSGYIHDLRINLSNNKMYVCGDQLAAVLELPYTTPAFDITVVKACNIGGLVSYIVNSDSGTFNVTWKDSSGLIIRTEANTRSLVDTLPGAVPGALYAITVQEILNCGADTFTVTKNVRLPLHNEIIYDTMHRCAGDTVIIGAHHYFTDGVYRDSLRTIYGCDSVLNTTLTFGRFLDTLILNGCNGYSVNVGAHIYNRSGIYRDTFPHGACDSFVVTILTIHDSSSQQLDTILCAGQQLQINHAILTTDSSGTATMSSIFGCDSTINFHVHFVPLPAINAGNDTSIIEGDQISLLAIGASFSHWDNGALTRNINVSPPKTQFYIAFAIDSNGCSNEDSVWVNVQTGDLIKLPTAFSPNADGVNDFYTVFGKGVSYYHILIYNRYGELLYDSEHLDELNNYSAGWDGNYKGVPQPLGTYVYKVEYRKRTADLGSAPLLLKGNFELMR